MLNDIIYIMLKYLSEFNCTSIFILIIFKFLIISVRLISMLTALASQMWEMSGIRKVGLEKWCGEKKLPLP